MRTHLSHVSSCFYKGHREGSNPKEHARQGGDKLLIIMGVTT